MLKKFSFVSLFLYIVFFINIAKASNVKDFCADNLQPVYAVEDVDVDSVSGGSMLKDEKYINNDNQVYYFRAGLSRLSFYLILVDKNKHFLKQEELTNNKTYYQNLYIYNNLIRPYIIPFGKKSFSFKKGDIIGCIDDIKNLEYFKVKCYINEDHACWDEWE